MRIIATQLRWLNKVSYTAWVPVGSHSSITFIGNQCYGKVGTDPDPALYDDLPVGQERSAAVQRAYDARYGVAYAAIIAEYPHAIDGARDSGEILI